MAASGSNTIMSYLAVLAIRLIYSVMFLLSKMVFDDGMNNNIFVFYRQASATLVVLPFAIYYARKNGLPPLPFMTFCKIFLLAFVGITFSLNLNGLGLKFTTTTITAASSNVIPVITFFLAVAFGMELLKWNTISGFAKVSGIIICTGGVAVLTFYKGHRFTIIPDGKQLVHTGRHEQHETHHSTMTWLKGCFLLLVCNFASAAWTVFQGSVLKLYPSKVLLTSLQIFLSMLQSFIIAAASERDPEEWKLGWNTRLFAVVYCGVIATGVSYYLQLYVIERKGPVFLSMTVPISMIFTLIGSTLLLGEVVASGSIIGGTLLAVGLYSVLWGQTKDTKLTERTETMDVVDIERDMSQHSEIDKAPTVQGVR